MDRSELEVASPTPRSRPVTRSMGQGENMEVPSSPLRRAKRTRLCSSSSSVSHLGTGAGRDWVGRRGICGQGAPDPGTSIVPVASSGLVFRHREGFIISLESVLNHAVLLSSFTVPSSPTQDTSLRSFFDPSSQHRDWCPWVNTVEGGEALEDTATQTEKELVKAEPGWRVVLNTLLATRKCDRVPETEPVVSLAGSPAPNPSTQNTACPGLAQG